MKNRLFLFVVSIVFCAVISGCAEKNDNIQFTDVKLGMTEHEVKMLEGEMEMGYDANLWSFEGSIGKAIGPEEANSLCYEKNILGFDGYIYYENKIPFLSSKLYDTYQVSFVYFVPKGAFEYDKEVIEKFVGEMHAQLTSTYGEPKKEQPAINYYYYQWNISDSLQIRLESSGVYSAYNPSDIPD